MTKSLIPISKMNYTLKVQSKKKMSCNKQMIKCRIHLKLKVINLKKRKNMVMKLLILEMISSLSQCLLTLLMKEQKNLKETAILNIKTKSKKLIKKWTMRVIMLAKMIMMIVISMKEMKICNQTKKINSNRMKS